MSPRDLFRLIGPVGSALAAALAAAAVVLLAHGLGFRWDPFDRVGRRLAAAEVRAAAAEADAAARRLEVEASSDQARRIDIHHQQALELREVTVQAQSTARSAHDADEPLDAQRAARLAAHDRELCRIVPAVCLAAPVGAAGGGDSALSAGRPAGPTDDG